MSTTGPETAIPAQVAATLEPSPSKEPVTSEGTVEHDVYPEAGTRAWLTVAGASACLFVSFGWVNCIGIFQAYYQSNQLRNYTPSEIAWIPSLQIFMLFGGVIVGKIFDDHGPGLLLASGTFLHVIGLMLTSLLTSYASILSQAVVSALGASYLQLIINYLEYVSSWFKAKRGAALGLVVAGSSLGGVIFPIILIHLISQIGFGWAMRTCAFIILALLLFANATVRSCIPLTKKPFRLMAPVTPFTELPFSLLTAAIFFFYWGMFIPVTFIVEKARAEGMSEHLLNYLVPILNAASIIGRTIPNALADKFGHFNMMILMSTLTTALILALWLPGTGQSATIAFAVLFGISSGAGIGLTHPSIKTQYRSRIRNIFHRQKHKTH